MKNGPCWEPELPTSAATPFSVLPYPATMATVRVPPLWDSSPNLSVVGAAVVPKVNIAGAAYATPEGGVGIMFTSGCGDLDHFEVSRTVGEETVCAG